MSESSSTQSLSLHKTPTGIVGLDEITEGGLPKARPTLVCGSAGCGKTLFAMEFLTRGITQFDEPGVFLAFEETREELIQNFASLGFPLADFIAQNKLVIDHVSIDWDQLEQTGDYDLEGLLIRLDHAIKKVKAKRVVLDTIEVLFTLLGDTDILRAELRRIFRWLKDRGVTTIITGEAGEGTLTRRGIEAYISDCVILLDQRVEKQIARRRLRIVKYRGAKHGTDEYPFLIDETGFSVLPITSVGLDYPISDERISSGIPRLDLMLDGRGFFRGSTILISGSSGTGKTSLAAQFVVSACQRGERCLYFSFEEAPSQIIRNMRSVGIDLQSWAQADSLRFKSARPTAYSLDMHLIQLRKQIQTFDPQIVVIDPVTNFDVIGSKADSRTLLTHLIDFLKMNGITALLTSLTRGGDVYEQSEVHISSMIDTWLLVHNPESNGERNRVIYILKSRGMAHSNQISEFEITSQGIQLMDAYLGTAGVLTGSARLAQEAREYDETLSNQQTIELMRLQIESKRAAVMAQITALQAELDIENAETQLLLDQETRRKAAAQQYGDSIKRKRVGITSNQKPFGSRAEDMAQDEQ